MTSVSCKKSRSSYEIPTGDTGTFSNCDITSFEIQTEDIPTPPIPSFVFFLINLELGTWNLYSQIDRLTLGDIK